MANNRSLLVGTILLAILSIAGSFVINIITNNLPESLQSYVKYAYPIAGAIVVFTIVVIIWQWIAGQPPSVLPPRPAYVHEGWFLKHYYLAQDDFTGRESELDFLTDWLENKNDKPLLALIALGGFGKSALVWHWLNNDPAPKSLTKVVWWGFYDDSSFDTFLKETLEYLDIDPKTLSISEQVEMLARYVRQNRILIVMDGFERALRAYSSMSAAYQGDEENKSEPTNNQCVFIHAGRLLERVASINAQGRVLLTSRLLPDDLKIKGSGNLIVGCLHHELDKLSKEDAVAFFKKQNINGSRAEIEAACEVYGYHPLSLRLLSGRIVQERSRDIRLAEKFKIDSDLKGRQNHILKVAYESLPKRRRLLLSKIAAFRSPISLEDIRVFEEKPKGWRKIIFGRDDLQLVLNDFVSRGLLHHDPNKDKYDLHPIVRRFAYDRLTASDRTAAHTRLVNYFDAVPKPQKVNTLEDLAPVIELYHHMVGAGNLDEAVNLLSERLVPNPLHYQFGAYQLMIELKRALFPDGEDKPPRLKREDAQRWTLTALANSYSLSGQPRRAVPLFEMGNVIDEKAGDKKNLAMGLSNVADDQLKIGTLSAAERNLRRQIDLCCEIVNEFLETNGHQELGRVLSYRGEWQEAEQELTISTKYWEKTNSFQGLCLDESYHALCFLLIAREAVGSSQLSVDSVKSAIQCAQRSLELADEWQKVTGRANPNPRDYTRGLWLLGSAYRANWVSTGSTTELTLAEENLSKALNLCRQINMVDHEADILLDLARLRYAQGDFKDVQEKASEALVITERSGYVLQGADVNLFLATLALEGYKLEGLKVLSDKDAAIHHAKEALRLATCDGPPYYYKVAYEEAEKLLASLKV